MAAWVALVLCLAAAVAAAPAEEYYGYEHDPESWRDISPVAHTTSQEELDAVVSQVLAHDKPEGYLDGYTSDGDADLAELEVYVEMETTEEKKEGDSADDHIRYPRHPHEYYHSPHEHLRPVVLARKEYPYQTLPQGDYYYEEADWPVAPARDWQAKRVISKPVVVAPYRQWSHEPVATKAVVVGKHVDYVDRYKPVYVEKPRFRETDFVETKELIEHGDGGWPGDFIDRKAVFVEKSVDTGIKPLPYKHVIVEGRKGWEPHHRPFVGKEYFDYGYGPHVVSKEVLVPVKNYHAKPYVIERYGGDKEEFETDAVHVREGPEGEEIVEVDKDVKTDVDKKLIVEPIVTEDGVETLIEEEEDKDIVEDVKESVQIVSPYDMKE
ncbi:uncharacterized protein LOC126473335 [Schistocerca serialis cubense]|uniref:uncharacterized protein LOC126473335 n=1 Tax=Schistocerca serialis cubense TaxID=2023355 RepID=UPI00214EFBDD|nr:uncharacterized protein LOC126473335 [Schistocerca serialis cubense]